MNIKKYKESLEGYWDKKSFTDYYKSLSEEEKKWLNNYNGDHYAIGLNNFIMRCPVCNNLTFDNEMICPTCGWKYSNFNWENSEENPEFIEYRKNYESRKIK